MCVVDSDPCVRLAMVLHVAMLIQILASSKPEIEKISLCTKHKENHGSFSFSRLQADKYRRGVVGTSVVSNGPPEKSIAAAEPAVSRVAAAARRRRETPPPPPRQADPAASRATAVRRRRGTSPPTMKAEHAASHAAGAA